MPQQAWSDKRERQYEHIKAGLKKKGRSEDTAEEIAARTVNKERARSRARRGSAQPDLDQGHLVRPPGRPAIAQRVGRANVRTALPGGSPSAGSPAGPR